MAGWAVGVAINLAGSVLINLGTNMMKLGHNKRAAMPPRTGGQAPSIRSIHEWQLGVTLFTLGNVGNFVSLGYAAQSLLAAIGCVQFVSNVVFAYVVLKEQVSRGVLAATACIVGGCVLLVSFGSHSSKAYTYTSLLHLYQQPVYIAYLSVSAAVVVAAYAAYWAGQKAVMRGLRSARIWAAALPVLYSLFSAIVGTQSVLFSKTLAVLLRATASGDNQLTKPFTWIVLPAFLVTAIFWVTRLNKGLTMFPAMIIVPTLQICWTLFSILSGMLYFQEYAGMSGLGAAMFVLGVVVVFLGVFLLTNATAGDSNPRASTAGVRGPLLLELTKAQLAEAQLGVLEQEGGSPGRMRSVIAPRCPTHIDGDEATADGGVRGPAAINGGGSVGAEDDGAQDDPYALHAGANGDNEDDELMLLAPPALDSRQPRGSSVADGRQRSSGPSPEPDSEARPRQLQMRFASAASLAKLSRRVRADFSLDEATAARLSLGLGGEGMPGVSLFAMPMVDLNGGSPKVSVLTRKYGMLPDRSVAGGHAAAKASSRGAADEQRGFFGGGADGGSLPSAAAVAAARQQHGAGAAAGINPLANAIEQKCSSTSSSSSSPSKGGLLSSMDSAARSLRSNMRELGSSIQAAAAGGGPRGGFSRLRAPQRTAEEEMLPILDARDFAAADDEQQQRQHTDEER